MNPVNIDRNTRPRQKAILLVDDDLSVREMVGRVLAAEDYFVLPAANGAEALSIAAANRIGLVLLDLNLPGHDGWDTFEKLTANDPLLPVIIITARPNQLFTSLGAGVGALLEKPLDFPTLLQTMRALLAEPPQVRLARSTGRHADFHYSAADGRTIARTRGTTQLRTGRG